MKVFRALGISVDQAVVAGPASHVMHAGLKWQILPKRPLVGKRVTLEPTLLGFI